MALITKEQLENASSDAESLATFVNADENTNVATRLGAIYPTVKKFLKGILDSANNILNSLGYLVPVNYAAGISLTTPNQTVSYNGIVYAPVSNQLPFTTSGTFETAKFRIIQTTSRTLNSGDFGTVGNGAITGGVLTGTNSTAAFNAAITAAGKTKRLEVPDGIYVITPGAMVPIQCDFYAPGATFIGSDDSNGHILNLDYEETYPVNLGSGLTGLNAWKTCKVHQIIGSPNGDAAMKNIAIHCDRLNQSRIDVDVIRGASCGLYLDGNKYNSHQGTNQINITHLYMCEIGFLGQGGNDGNMCEANRVTGQYWFGFKTAAISLAGGGNAVRVDNVFDIISMSPFLPGGHGVFFDGLCSRNTVNLRSWDSGPSGSGKNIVSTGYDNIFRVPSFNIALNECNGNDIIDTLTFAGDGKGRSNVTAPGVPSSGRWRVGDKIWNTAPTVGSVPGWICTQAGIPGTWTEMGTLAGSPKFKAFMDNVQAVVANQSVSAVFPRATANVSLSYNVANGVFQPSVPGYYQINASLAISANGLSFVTLELFKNDAIDTVLVGLPTSVQNTLISGGTLIYMNGTTDKLNIRSTVSGSSGATFQRGSVSGFLAQST